MQKQIFITIEGGLVQNVDVTNDLDDIEITLIDLDIEGSSLKETKSLPNGDEAFIQEYETNNIEDGDIEYFKEIKENR